MIYLKTILACLLSALPFVYAWHLRNKARNNAPKGNVYSFIMTQLPRLYALFTAIKSFVHGVYEGMKKSDTFRRFFSLIIILVMLTVQFIDFNASANIAHAALQAQLNGTLTPQFMAVYEPLMSRPQATLLAACLSLMLFSYKAADWMLTRLHDSNKIFFFTAVITLIILFSSPRHFIVAEMMELLLLAAIVYPDKTADTQPKGRKPVPLQEDEQQLRQAA